jgi:hypothetical protein
MHGRSGQETLSSRLEIKFLMDSTVTTDDYMWIGSYQFQGIWLYIEAINRKLDGSLSTSERK